MKIFFWRILLASALIPLLVLPLAAHAAEITIGTGTSDWILPLATGYQDARTQTIYLASEIGMSGQITSLALDVSILPGQVMNNFTIRIKHTALAEYTSPASWEDTGWSVVYQTNQTISATGWNTFSFSSPFNYNGTDNLMVDISFDNSSSSSYGRCRLEERG